MSIQKRKEQSYRAERTLMKFLREYGIWSWRIPSSGYKTSDYALPDVIGLNKNPKETEILGFEVKCTNKDQRTIRLKEDESPILIWIKKREKLPCTSQGLSVREVHWAEQVEGNENKRETISLQVQAKGSGKAPRFSENTQRSFRGNESVDQIR